MKRTVINVLLWLTAGALALVLYFRVLNPPQVNKAIAKSMAKTNEQIELVKKKNELKQQMVDLNAEIKEKTKSPFALFILFTTTNETVLREAAVYLDQEGQPALLGVAEETLLIWQQGGVPSYVSERLEKGWELCLVLDQNSAAPLQERLRQLQLPIARAAYCRDEAVIDSDDLQIILKKMEPENANITENRWHILAMGNSVPTALDEYKKRLGTGGGIAFLIGDYDADRYMRDNLKALLDLIREDQQDQLIRCVSVEEAFLARAAWEKQTAPLFEVWLPQLKELEEQLNEIENRIM